MPGGRALSPWTKVGVAIAGFAFVQEGPADLRHLTIVVAGLLAADAAVDMCRSFGKARADEDAGATEAASAEGSGNAVTAENRGHGTAPSTAASTSHLRQ
eukprot:TRINITY_DN27713_c0_g1_i1.p3 TRINITY_DN27713_c0_g1~~TRINITY_DN27713_c0_g1_i1.p3  ORF type:complete len:117 (+),score=28.35 TRINITY_DN27713_c0_g1_i1:54-353(+)